MMCFDPSYSGHTSYSGHIGWLLMSCMRFETGKLVSDTDQVRKGNLSIAMLHGDIGFGTFKVDPRAGTLGTGSRQTEYHSRAVTETNAQPLVTAHTVVN